ncbi:uncharacterized protein UHOD_02463 [Ustilago sp. UG-2017b]|nr:uncharacterized protein UHOD_02463 [Ustilago sp. UG-2017b]
MVAARKQRQVQKAQEQAISKALAEPKPSTSHVSFGDDDDSNTQEAGSSLNVRTAAHNFEASDDGSEDDDAPVEVVSNKTSKKQASQDSARAKAQEKAEKAKRQAAEQKRLKKQKEKEAATAKELQPSNVREEAEEQIDQPVSEGWSDSKEEEASSTTRLDPSLFAEVFAQPVSAPKSILKKRLAEERADEVAKLQRERKQRRKEQRAGGVVKGRDGLPMKRAEDGTILRALTTSNRPSARSSSHKTSFDDEDGEQPDEPLDEVVRPTQLDRSASLPNAKARAFLKRALERKKGGFKSATSAKGASAAKKQKNQDDPLGLNDPAFLPGGEFYHLVNKGDNAKAAKQGHKDSAASARQAFRGGGVRKDAVSVLRARSRGGPSLGFARSQEGSDDDY